MGALEDFLESRGYSGEQRADRPAASTTPAQGGYASDNSPLGQFLYSRGYSGIRPPQEPQSFDRVAGVNDRYQDQYLMRQKEDKRRTGPVSWGNFADKSDALQTDYSRMFDLYDLMDSEENLSDVDSYVQAIQRIAAGNQRQAQALADFARENQDEFIGRFGYDAYMDTLSGLNGAHVSSGYAGSAALDKQYLRGEQEYLGRQEEQQEAKKGLLRGAWDYLNATISGDVYGAADARAALAEAWDKGEGQTTDWQGREALVAEYERLQNVNFGLESMSMDPNPMYDRFTREAMMEENEQSMAEIRAALEEGDRKFGNGPRAYSALDKFSSFVGGSAKTVASSIGKAGLMVGDAMSKRYADAYTTDQFLMDYFLGEDGFERRRQIQEAYNSPEAQAQRQRFYDAVGKLGEAGQADIERVKNGYGIIGQAGVDIAENLLQMGFDATAGNLLPGGALTSMFIRVLGDEGYQALQNGATLEEALAYGGLKGGIEVFTEKLFDGVAGIYGKGAADDLSEAAIRRITNEVTGKLGESNVGQFVMRFIGSGIAEGNEELLSDLLGPLAEKVYRDESLGELYGALDPADVIYDWLIGFAVGEIGQVGAAAGGQYAEANAENRALSDMYAQMGETPTLRQELIDRSLLQEIRENGAQNVTGRETITGGAGEDTVRSRGAGRSGNARQNAQEMMDALAGKKTKEDRARELMDGLWSAAVEGAAAGRQAAVDAVREQIEGRGSDDIGDAETLAEAIVADENGEALTEREEELIEQNRELVDQLRAELRGEKKAKWARDILINPKNRITGGAGEDAIGEDAAPEDGAAAREALSDERLEATVANQYARAGILGAVTGMRFENGRAVVEIRRPDGGTRTYDVDEVRKIVPQELGDLMYLAAGAGRDARAVFLGYEKGQKIGEYSAAMDAAINLMAANGAKREYLDRSALTASLTEEQKDIAWEIGHGRFTGSGSREAVKLRQGGVYFDGNTRGIEGLQQMSEKDVRRAARAAWGRDYGDNVALASAVGAATGLKIVFFDSTQADGSLGTAKGMYDRKGTVYIDIHAGQETARDSRTAGERIVARTMSHELTHFLEQNAPEEYRTLKGWVANELLRRGDGSFEELVARRMGTSGRSRTPAPTVDAGKGGQEQSRGPAGGLSYAEAANEVVADACETMLVNSEAVQRLAYAHYGTARKIWEHIKGMFRRMQQRAEPKSREAKLLEGQRQTMGVLWDKALEKAVERGKSAKNPSVTARGAATAPLAGEPGKTPPQSGSVQYAIRYPSFTESEIRENISTLQRMDSVKDLSGEEFASNGKRLFDNVVVFFNKLGGKVFSEQFGDVDLTKSSARSDLRHGYTREKITAFAAIPEVIKNGVVIGTIRKNTDLERIIVAAPITISQEKYYMGVMLQRDSQSQRLYMHDVVIEKETDSSTDEHLVTSGPSASEDDLFLTSILRKALAVKEKSNTESNNEFSYSLRDDTSGDTEQETAERVRSYNRLKADNEALRRQLERARREIKPTKEAKVSRSDAVKAAKKILEGIRCGVDAQELADTIEAMGNYVLRTEEKDWNGDVLWRLARESAADIAATAWEPVDSGMNEIEQTLKSYLEGKRLYLYEKYVPGLGQGTITTWKKYNPGIRVSTKTGLPVDTAYHELQELLGPGLLPDDVTHPADQLNLIADLLQDAKRKETYNPFRAYQAEATESLTQDILDVVMSDTLSPEAATYADRQAEKLRRETVKAADRAAREEARQNRLALIRQEHRERIAEIRRDAKTRVDEVRAKEKAEKWAKVKRLREYYREKEKAAAARRKESAGVQKYRTRVENAAKKLTDMLVKNTDKEHVPESLKEPLADFLMSLDFTSTSVLRGGDDAKPTKKDKIYTNRLEALLDVLRRQQAFQENESEHDNVLGWHLDLPPGFTDQFRDHIEFMRAFEMTDASQPVNKMTAQQLKELADFMDVLQHSISKLNQFLTDSHYAGVREAAMATVAELQPIGGVQARKIEGAGKNVDRYFNWANALPYYVFKRFGKAGAERFAAIAEGWGKMAFNVEQIKKYVGETYTAEEVRDWEQERHEIELESGETATMTTAQMMAFYCLAKREQGLNHLEVGGMRVGNIEGSGKDKALAQTKAYNLTIEDMTKIGGMLTERQLAVADKLQRFMNTVCSEWGNEVSMARFGYRAFTEQFYFPINIDRNGLEKDDPAARANDLYRMLNISATKALTPNAHNAVVIESIFDVFANHTSDMAKYNALALPILDTFKWFGYQHRDYIPGEDAAGNKTTALRVESVQKSIETAFGRQGQEYFRNFMKDLNGVKEGGRNESFFKGIVGRYKAAAVAANLRVALQQPTSIARAALLLDPKYLMRGAAPSTIKGGIEEALRWSGLAVWKKMGFFDTNIARGMREQIKHAETWADKLRDKSMGLAEKGDELTWGAIWNACRLETEAKTKLQGEELMKATAKRFNEVILATQVMDSTISRSDMMRSNSLGIAEYTSFMAEPTVTYNALLDLKTEFELEKRRSGSFQTAFNKTKGKLVRTGTVYCVSAALTAAMAAIADAARDDDEYESVVEKWLEHFAENFKDNLAPWELLPGLADAIEILRGESDGKNMVAQTLEQVKNVIGMGEEIWKSQVLHEEVENKRTTWGKLYQIAQAASSLSGIGIAPGLREFKTVWNNSIGLAVPSWKLKTYDAGAASEIRRAVQAGHLSEEEAVGFLVEAGEYDDTASGKNAAYWTVRGWIEGDGFDRWQGVYDAALKGDRNAFREAEDFMGEHGYSASAVRGQMNSQIRRWYAGGEIDDRKARELLTEYGSALSDWEAKNTVREWSMEAKEGFRYDEIQERYVSGKITDAEAARLLLNYGPDAETKGETRNAALREAQEKVREWKSEKETGIPFTKLQDAYIHGEIGEREAIDALRKYGGEDQDSAEAKVLQWNLAKEAGIRYSSTDYGIKAAYLHDEISMETAQSLMVVYGGKTEEQAAAYANQYDFTKQTGFEWKDGKGIQEAILSGRYSDEELSAWMVKCDESCHGSELVAEEKVECAHWLSEVEGCTTFTRDHLEKWNKSLHRLKNAGLGKEDFARAVAAYAKEKSDYDARTGESIEYSKCRKVMAYIDGLQITREQKEALALSLYSEKYVKKCRRW